jgi:hypothetical protein
MLTSSGHESVLRIHIRITHELLWSDCGVASILRIRIRIAHVQPLGQVTRYASASALRMCSLWGRLRVTHPHPHCACAAFGADYALCIRIRIAHVQPLGQVTRYASAKAARRRCEGGAKAVRRRREGGAKAARRRAKAVRKRVVYWPSIGIRTRATAPEARILAPNVAPPDCALMPGLTWSLLTSLGRVVAGQIGDPLQTHGHSEAGTRGGVPGTDARMWIGGSGQPPRNVHKWSCSPFRATWVARATFAHCNTHAIATASSSRSCGYADVCVRRVVDVVRERCVAESAERRVRARRSVDRGGLLCHFPETTVLCLLFICVAAFR